MTILLVVEPGINGAFRHVEALAGYLISKKQCVHLAYSDVRGSTALIQLVETVQRNGGRCLNLQVDNLPQRKDLAALLKLWKLATEIRPAVIHGHSSKAGVLARTLALLGIKAHYFYTAHAYYGLSRQNDRRLLLFNFLESIFGRVGATINISVDEQKFAFETLRIPPHRSILINNPVDTGKFVPATLGERNRLRKQWGLPLEARVLGSMGRLSFQKDPQTLYKSFGSALKEGDNLYLLHVGNGELGEELDTLVDQLGIKNRLIRIPYLENPQEFYAAVDAVIMTSRYEAFWPLVILEALACNLPVISCTGPGTSDLGVAGLSHCWPLSLLDSSSWRCNCPLESHRCLVP